MEKMNYEDRVRQIAEEMAKEYCNGEMPNWTEKSEELVDMHEYAARIAVAKMAEAFIEGWGESIGCRGAETIPEDGKYNNEKLTEYGLIPDKTEPDNDPK